MPVAAEFDLPGFAARLSGLPALDRSELVRAEMKRVDELTMRESNDRFQQQMYLRRLQRLLNFLGSQNLPSDLTPSEKRAYSLLAGA